MVHIKGDRLLVSRSLLRSILFLAEGVRVAIRRYATWILGALIALLALNAPGSAETVLRRITFKEGVDRDVLVSGQRIVGVSLGAPLGNVDHARLYVDTTASRKPTSICVRATTSDAVYWSLSAHLADAGANDLARLDYPTEHARLISGYSRERFAIRALLSDSCVVDSDGVILPVAFSPTSPHDELVVSINTGEAFLEAGLYKTDGAAVTPTTPCQRIQGPRQAFAWTCRIKAQSQVPAGTYRMQVAVTTSSGKRGAPITALIAMPAMGPPR